jgi:Family of unknown function (DUF5681)
MEKNKQEHGKVRLKSGGNTDMRPQDHGGSLNTGGDHERTGRPRKLPALDEILAKVLSEEQEGGVTVAEALIRSLYNQAIKGNTGAAKLLLERAYGLMKHTIDMNTAPQELDLSAFTDDELRQYITILEKIGTKTI